MMIKVYSTPTCPYCVRVKDYLKSKNVKFAEYNVASDDKAKKEMIKKTGQLSVPVIEIKDKIIIGFDKDEIDKALNEL